MVNMTGDGMRRRWVALGTVTLSLMTSVAIAGPEEDTVQAESEFARGNLIVALSLWRKAADAGYAPAQVRLGDMYDKAEDDKDAVEWYRKAAIQGNAAGEFGLGEMYAKGEGVAKDYAQAYSHISRAAEKGYLPAIVLMREIYRNGSMGVAADPVKSAEWDAKAQKTVAQEKPAATKASASSAPSSADKK